MWSSVLGRLCQTLVEMLLGRQGAEVTVVVVSLQSGMTVNVESLRSPQRRAPRWPLQVTFPYGFAILSVFARCGVMLSVALVPLDGTCLRMVVDMSLRNSAPSCVEPPIAFCSQSARGKLGAFAYYVGGFFGDAHDVRMPPSWWLDLFGAGPGKSSRRKSVHPRSGSTEGSKRERLVGEVFARRMWGISKMLGSLGN